MLYLASQSPRRSELLEKAGISFQLVKADADEIHDASMEMETLCQKNASAKAWAGLTELLTHSPEWQRYENAHEATASLYVLGADTLVFLDGKPLGKPRDLEEARLMLRSLSGKKHFVCTGVALVSPKNDNIFSEVTEVTFKELSDEVIDAYMSKVHVLDKAGSYAFQEHGDMIIAETKGDTDNVIGLPVNRVLETLKGLYPPL